MNQIKNRLPVVLVLIGIVLVWVYRFSSLSNPYFWDEMGVYGYGVQYLVEHGISILPNAMPPDISRGHPLLFYAIHALVLEIVGNSFAVSHAFALIISSCLLISIYYLAKEFVPKLMASMAVLLFASLNIFLAQSTLILPEMLLALLSTIALLFYFKQKYIWLAIALSVGVLIKESMLLTAGFFGIAYLITCLHTRSLKENLGKLLLFTIPLGVFLLFLLVQKAQNGWYFFPYHTAIVKEGAWSGFFEKMQLHYNFVFFKQGRNQWLIFIAVSLVAMVIKAAKVKTLVLISYFIFALTFFSLAFYMDRYLLFLYPVLVILVADGVWAILSSKRYLAVGVMCLLIFNALSQLKNPSFRYDASLSYLDIVAIHSDVTIDLCELSENKLNCWANFPMNMSLMDSRFGYVSASCQEKIQLVPEVSKANYILLYRQDFQDDSFELLNPINSMMLKLTYIKNVP